VDLNPDRTRSQHFAPGAGPPGWQPALRLRREPATAPGRPARPDPAAAKQDGVQLIAAAASLEPELAGPRLARAAQAVTQFFGPGGDELARQWLDKPMQVDDFESVLELLAPGVARNPRLAQVVIKSALFALRDENNELSPEAARLIKGLRARLLGGETV
jgi:hypothetical protein